MSQEREVALLESKGATGDPGAARGVQGPPSPQGPAGASGDCARPQLDPLSVVPSATTGTYSLNGGSWTQTATETNLFFGQVTVTMPASCRLRPCNGDSHARRCRHPVGG